MATAEKGTTITGEQNLLVTVRIRPLSDEEIYSGARLACHKIQDEVVVLLDPLEDSDDILRANRSRERQYVFDHTLDGSAAQEEVYQNTTRFLIDNVVKGYNATVFAYGATGAGKTYTMLGTDSEPGVMFRAMEDLFREMERTAEESAYKVSMSYLEIYNEQIRDLLNTSSGVLDLREDSRGVAQVAGLREIQTRSTGEVMRLLTRGNMARTTEPTAANKTSSRSHAVLQITVHQKSRVPAAQEEVRTGRLFLIDLAGSERASNTNNRGKRMVEGAHINRSLLALGNCINALAERAGPKYINYRDSKLTRLLKDALGGNCKTVMIAHVSPNMAHYEESRNTLVYADRAKHIKTKVRRNVTDVNYHIAQYTNIISELRQEIFRLRNRLDESGSTKLKGVSDHSDNNDLNKMKEKLLSSFQEQMELRRTVMELDNTLMELTLEMTRSSQVISEWETEKAIRSQNREEKTDDPRLAAAEKEAELRGLEEVPDPEEVLAARGELKVLQEERQRVDKMKLQLERDMEENRLKAKKMEESLPLRVNSEDQKEILMLLCKVHELEIENTEMQSEAFLKEHEIRKRDIIISKLRNHRQLCDEIISQQRQLLQFNRISTTKELEEMIEVYQQEANDAGLVESNSSLPDIRKSDYITDSTNEMRDFSSDVDEPETPQRRKSDEKVFNFSSKSRHILEAKSREEASNRDVLENHSNPVSISPQKPADISSKTRKIVALARKRKEGSNLTAGTGTLPPDNLSFLTPSRLARHDKNFESMGNLRRYASDDDMSVVTAAGWAEAAASVTAAASGTAAARRRQLADRKKANTVVQLQPFEPRVGDLQFEPEDYFDEVTDYFPHNGVGVGGGGGGGVGGGQSYHRHFPPLRKNFPKTHWTHEQQTHDHRNHVATTRNRVPDHKLQKNVFHGGKSVQKNNKKKPVYTIHGRVVKGDKKSTAEDLREFDTVSMNSGTMVYQLAPDRGRGHTLQKTSRAPDNQLSPLGTPTTRKTARKPPPTIPAYRKADIGITGYSFAK